MLRCFKRRNKIRIALIAETPAWQSRQYLKHRIHRALTAVIAYIAFRSIIKYYDNNRIGMDMRYTYIYTYRSFEPYGNGYRQCKMGRGVKSNAHYLLGQGPVYGMEFFVFRKTECRKQINHLLLICPLSSRQVKYLK